MTDGDPLETAKALRGNADSAAGHVRGLYISFLAVAVYIGVIIGSTSDEQLLRLEPVTLPLLGVGLPIVAFYALVPWLFVLLHFNILLQHYLLSRKLHLLAAALARVPDPARREAERAQLFSFAFSHLLVPGREGGLMRLFYGVMVWSTLILLPLGILLWAQIRFLPYHDPVSTWSQRAAILLDVALLWIFWPRTLIESGRFKDQVKGILGTWTGSREIAIPLSGVSALAIVVSCFAALVPGEGIERAGLGITPLVRALFDAPNAPFHRSLQLAEAVLVQGGDTPEATAALRSRRIERHQEVLPRIAGLVLANRDLRYADLRGAILPKADLRGAALDGARLGGANLSQTNIGPYEAAPGRRCASGMAVDREEIAALGQGGGPTSFWLQAEVTQPDGEGRSKLCRASLKSVTASHAVLQDAVLSFAWIEDSGFPRSAMTAANLSKAVLRRVSATAADLEGARFTLAEGDGLDLEQSALRLAKFDRAQLTALSLDRASAAEILFDDARLEQVDANGLTALRASFEGAVLSRISLVGAKLGQATFARAALSDIDLTDADLDSAAFAGAELARLRLDRANLKDAEMAGLDLSGTHLVRAKLAGTSLARTKLIGAQARDAELLAADLAGADLRGADLSGARIQGSDLTGADLRGSRLENADLLGVFLAEARLQGARLEQARFRGVDLSGAWLDPHFMNRRLRALGKAASSAAINLLGARFEVMTEAERAELTAAVAPYSEQMISPWRLAQGDGASEPVDWPVLGEIAYCRNSACLDLEGFAAAYAKHLSAYACKDSASMAMILRRFPLVRGESAEAKAYKHTVATSLVAARCNPRYQLTDRLEVWAGRRPVPDG